VYEWDEAKREQNLQKHGLDFADAYLVYENPEKLTLLSPFPEEDRRMDYALVEVQGRVLVLVYTQREERVRCISFRVASRKERILYEANKP
jgi:uncharacterized protein